MKKILILGGAGMLGPYVIPALDQKYDLLVTDIRPLDMAFRGEFRQVDVAAYDQVLDAAAGMDAIINLSVLRQDRQLAFDVSTLGCYNMMRAAVAHGIQRVINTGPHFTVAGATYEAFDFNLSPDMPPQGENLDAHIGSKYGASPQQLAASREAVRERAGNAGAHGTHASGPEIGRWVLRQRRE